MNLKRWFAAACLALTIVAEFFLYHATHARNAAQAELQTARVELRQAQDQVDDLKNSNAGLQASEILRLRKLNEILTNRVTELQSGLAELKAEYEQTADHLVTARRALKLQQDHLAELEQEKNTVVVAGVSVLNQNHCIANLRHIDLAKQEWALDKNRSSEAIPSERDLRPYLKGRILPTCPAGGIYLLNSVSEFPVCSLPGHDLVPR